MRKLTLILSTILVWFLGFSFASGPSIINDSYTTNWNDVTIFWTNNSNGGNVNIRLLKPDTQNWVTFDTIAIADEYFTYTKQRSWEQTILLVPDDWWDEVKIIIPASETIARTVIESTPKTWPSWHTIMVIILTFVVFGWYIYIKKQANL